MTQLVVQVTAVLMLAMMLVAVDLTVLVVSTKGQAWQGLLQGLIPVSFLLGRSGVFFPPILRELIFHGG